MHSRKGLDGTKYSVFALCDAELLGKYFEEGDFALDIKANAAFYKGEKVSKAQAVALIRKAVRDDHASLNIVGKKSVEALQASGVKGFKARKVAGVPHVQVFHV